MAYLVNEETNHLILADENLLSFIVTMLNNACRSEDRRYSGFSAKELAEGLSYLAVNDTNKMVLGNNGAVHALMSMLKTSSDDEERAIAVKALWMLAFDNNNKEAIRREVGGLKILRELQRSKDPDVQKAAAGTLWELEGKTMNGSEKSEVTQNHVMISYQWDNQEVLIEVKNRLQARDTECGWIWSRWEAPHWRQWPKLSRILQLFWSVCQRNKKKVLTVDQKPNMLIS